MSNSSSLSEEATSLSALPSTVRPSPSSAQLQAGKKKKKKRAAGNPDPGSEVIALSAAELLATHRFKCEVCNKGFQRDQNLQLHRRGHNLPWKLKKDRNHNGPARKKVYVCPEPSCVHHRPERALGDLTGVKKHFSRKHGEKIWKCNRCARVYAVESDIKAHLKTCGSKQYICECRTVFSRRDSFISHRAFCDALAQESARIFLQNQGQVVAPPPPPPFIPQPHSSPLLPFSCSPTSQNPNPLSSLQFFPQNPNPLPNPSLDNLGEASQSFQNLPFSSPPPTANLTVTEQLLQEMDKYGMGTLFIQKDGVPTRDFLGLREEDHSQRINSHHAAQVSKSLEGMLNCTMGTWNLETLETVSS